MKILGEKLKMIVAVKEIVIMEIMVTAPHQQPLGSPHIEDLRKNPMVIM